MLFNCKSGRKRVVRRSGRPTDKRGKERPNGPQPYIYNMYRDRPECRYAIYYVWYAIPTYAGRQYHSVLNTIR